MKELLITGIALITLDNLPWLVVGVMTYGVFWFCSRLIALTLHAYIYRMAPHPDDRSNLFLPVIGEIMIALGAFCLSVYISVKAINKIMDYSKSYFSIIICMIDSYVFEAAENKVIEVARRNGNAPILSAVETNPLAGQLSEPQK